MSLQIKISLKKNLQDVYLASLLLLMFRLYINVYRLHISYFKHFIDKHKKAAVGGPGEFITWFCYLFLTHATDKRI